MSNCKYYKQKKQVSYDSAQTWSDVSPAEYQVGDLYQIDSQDCSEIGIIRWVIVPGDYLCDGKDKYQKEIEQYTIDGVVWRNMYPTTYRKGNLIESNSSLCDNKWEGHYIETSSISCPKWYKWVDGVGCVYVDPIKFVRCSTSSSTTLTSDDVNYHPYKLIYGTIGDCVTSIGDYAFENCSGLTSVNIPDNVTAIGRGAFEWCSNLENVTIGNGVTTIGNWAFYGCLSLESVTCLATTPPVLTRLPKTPGEEQEAYHTFESTNNYPIYVPCESLYDYRRASGWANYESRLVGIPPCSAPTPSGATKVFETYSNDYVYFAYCNSSSVLTMNEAKPTGFTTSLMDTAEIGDCVTSIGYQAFAYCRSLTSISISNSVTSIDAWAFSACTSLTSIDIPNSVTSIGYGAFSRCSGLTEITIPSGVTSITGGDYGNEGMFYRCYGLTSVTLSKNLTSIGDFAFCRCTSLTGITIPSGVTSIGYEAFAYCSGLTNVTCLATTPPTLDDYAFLDTSNCPIYVPAGSVDTYKAANKWRTYASRIQAIP